MLVRTPKPADTESFLGYLLRVSESNGYDTPWRILKLAGICQSEMTKVSFPVSKVCKILGVSAESLSHISYRHPGHYPDEYKILGHGLGSSINQPILRLATPALCPECVRANGYIDAFYDLKLAVACPVHKRAVITNCPTCGEILRFFRPGLLTCRCGASLEDAAPVPVPAAVTDLMKVIAAKLHSGPLDQASVIRQLPIESLMAMPLRALITKLPTLLHLHGTSTCERPIDVVELLAEALSDWPKGLHRFLAKAEELHRDDPMSHLIRSKQLSASFFRKEIRESFAWLQQELTQHSQHSRGKSIHSRRKLHAEAQRRFHLSEELESADVGLRAEPLSHATPNHKLQKRDAAAYLGLPVSVLAALQATSHFAQKYRTGPKSGYQLAELDLFYSRLLKSSPRIHPSRVGTTATVSMSHALGKYRMHDSKQKAALVMAYLSGSLASIGRVGNSTNDILFRIRDVSAFVASSRTHAAGGTLTQQQAAQTLGCDLQAIPILVSNGYLTARSAREGTRITRASFEGFLQKYIPLSKIAKENATNSRRLKSLCSKAGIPMLLTPRPTGSEVPFIQRSSLELLLVTATLYPNRKQAQLVASHTRHSVVAILKSYLSELTNRKEPLPVRAGRPNKVAIARTCGFSRNVLYDNNEALELLDNFVAQASMPSTPLVALQRYLEELQTRREQLPLRAGKPNKLAIARACGFNRNVLYVNAEVVSLLNTFSSQQSTL
ncbi:TniQ family protein [Niveibacterium microcysteis]|uniref:TniQ family protein n=2 Tax=Niveibacterium microcysteis TaxID=2811415 RepID=A0ABX7M396_9RHOO|nr:TniQ family protein [Niveibacterium microcysteis]